MRDPLRISDVRFRPASDHALGSGLLGLVSFLIDGQLRVDSVAVRRTAGGRLTLSYPSREDRRGREHPILRPIEDSTRLEIERQVFAQLGLGEDAA